MTHGKWIAYKPEKLPEFAPFSALFARRESDGVDWYEYSRDPKSFSADSVKFTALQQDSGWVIGAAVRDAAMLHPANQLVLELIDYHGTDPQAELGGRLFNPDTNTLHDLPPPTLLDPMQEILDRIAAIEAKLGM